MRHGRDPDQRAARARRRAVRVTLVAILMIAGGLGAFLWGGDTRDPVPIRPASSSSPTTTRPTPAPRVGGSRTAPSAAPSDAPGTTSPGQTAATARGATRAPTPPSADALSVTTAAEATADPQDLEGRTVVLDPGHNGANGTHPSQINRQVDVGNGRKACNTTGTESASGLTESRLNWLLAGAVRRALQDRGARVVLTRRNDRGVGPCVDRRARFANRAEADAAVSIHGDGGPPGGRGFHVILPGRVPQVAGHDRIVGASARLGRAVRRAYRAGTGMPYSTYLGRSGVDRRTDLGGLNLLTVPGVMLETGNMRNTTDAGLMADGDWRRRAGRAIASGIGKFLTAGG